MASVNPNSDPAFSEVLVGIEVDSRSSLYAVTPQHLAIGLRKLELGFVPQTARMPVAESCIDKTHRAEIAFLLRQLSALALLSHPVWCRRTHSKAVTTRGPLPTRDEALLQLKDACKLMPESERGQLPSFEELLVLADNVSAIAVVSERLFPTPQARIYLALDNLYKRRFDTAAHVLRSVLSITSSPVYRTVAWINLGLVHEERGDFDAAKVAYKAASPANRPYVGASLNLFILCLRLGDKMGAIEAAEYVDSATEDEVQPFVSNLSVTRERGHWVPTPEALRVIQAIDPVLGPLSRLVTSTFASAPKLLADQGGRSYVPYPRTCDDYALLRVATGR